MSSTTLRILLLCLLLPTKSLAGVISVHTMSDLRALPPPNTNDSSTVFLEGYHTPGDGGGGQFFWDGANQESDDGGSRIRAHGAEQGRWRRVFSGPANVLWFGARADDKTDDSAAIIAAKEAGGIAYLPSRPGPRKTFYFISNTTIELKQQQGLIGDTAFSSGLRYTGKGTAIRGDSATPLNIFCQIRRLRIRVDTPSSDLAKPVVAVDWSRFSYSQFSDIAIELRAANQVGFYAAGNGKGSAPYYNSWTGIYVGGSANPKGAPNQRAFVLTSSGVGGSDGPNANVFNNIGHVWGVATAFDIQAGNGNMFYGVQVQSIQNYVFEFNGRGAGYSGSDGSKAVENKVYGVRVEGIHGAAFARFYKGASRNWIEGAFVHSIGPGAPVINEADDSNRITSSRRDLSRPGAMH